MRPRRSAAADRFIELEGAGSDRGDRQRFVGAEGPGAPPKLYAKAGVPELWLTDCRGTDLIFEVHVLGSAGYERQPADPEGWRLLREIRRTRLSAEE